MWLSARSKKKKKRRDIKSVIVVVKVGRGNYGKKKERWAMLSEGCHKLKEGNLWRNAAVVYFKYRVVVGIHRSLPSLFTYINIYFTTWCSLPPVPHFFFLCCSLCFFPLWLHGVVFPFVLIPTSSLSRCFGVVLIWCLWFIGFLAVFCHLVSWLAPSTLLMNCPLVSQCELVKRRVLFWKVCGPVAALPSHLSVCCADYRRLMLFFFFPPFPVVAYLL